MVSDCIDVLVFGKNWKARFALDSTIFSKISHKVEPGVRLATCASHGNQATDCKLGLFQHADFAGNLTDSTHGGYSSTEFVGHNLRSFAPAS